jgi:Calcium binding
VVSALRAPVPPRRQLQRATSPSPHHRDHAHVPQQYPQDQPPGLLAPEELAAGDLEFDPELLARPAAALASDVSGDRRSLVVLAFHGIPVAARNSMARAMGSLAVCADVAVAARRPTVQDPARRCAMATRRTQPAKKPATKKSTPKKPATSNLVVATLRRPAQSVRSTVGKARLKELVEEATVDAYNEDEQRVGFLTMIQDNLDVPFETEVLGVSVQVTSVDFNDAEEIVAICKRGAHVQRIPVVDLPLPEPPPEGFEWIEAYRFYQRGGG